MRLLSERVEEGGGVAEPMAYGGITPAVPWGGYREGEEVGMGSGGEGEMGDGDREAGSVGAERAGGGQQGLEEWVDTQTYIWIAPESELEDGEWDFEHFRREKLHLWAGAEAVDAGMMEADAFGSGGGDGAGRVDGWQDGTRGRGVVTGEFERAWEDRQREGEEVVRSAV